MLKWFCFMTVMVSAAACYYDSEEFLFPEINNECDTATVTFSGSVQPILQRNCFSCHNNTNAPSLGSNIKLEDHPDVLTRANNGSLFGAVNHEPGFSPMPLGGRKLSNCDLTIIKTWIDNGAPDN